MGLALGDCDGQSRKKTDAHVSKAVAPERSIGWEILLELFCRKILYLHFWLCTIF